MRVFLGEGRRRRGNANRGSQCGRTAVFGN